MSARRGARGGQRGFTLIEMMISMLVCMLLVGMILSIFGRMSLAFRGQAQIASLQQNLASARALMDTDAKQAGLALSSGFKIAADGNGTHGVLHAPIVITSGTNAPDQVSFAYADASAQAAVTASNWPTSLTVDDATAFKAGDLVVLSTPSTTTASVVSTTDANVATFDACVLQIASISGTAVAFSQSGTWGITGNTHCNAGATYSPQLNTAANGTMMYRFVAHAYRIDWTTTAAPADGQLEMSATGNLVPSLKDWTVQGFGFTDLQIATYFFDGDTTDTPDPDSDPLRDWWSSAQQDTYTTGYYKDSAGGISVVPIELSISIVARTDRDVEGLATTATPALTVATNTANNTVGDRASFALPAVTSSTCNAACVAANSGNRIYRYTTFTSDLRNLGVGR